MRKCPYCGMLTDAGDNCAWCKRSISAFMYPSAPRKAGPKKPSKYAQAAKGTILGVATIAALYVLAHQRSGPDAARIKETTVASVVKPHTTQGPASTAISSVTAATPSAPLPQTDFGPSRSVSAAPRSGLAVGASARPLPAQSVVGTAKLASINISTQNSGDGTETAVGTVTIVNQSPYEISDFQLTLSVNGVTSPLAPFQGDTAYPSSVSSRRIPPHGRLQLAVMTPTRYPAAEVAARSVQLVAHFDGQSAIATDSASLQ